MEAHKTTIFEVQMRQRSLTFHEEDGMGRGGLVLLTNGSQVSGKCLDGRNEISVPKWRILELLPSDSTLVIEYLRKANSSQTWKLGNRIETGHKKNN